MTLALVRFIKKMLFTYHPFFTLNMKPEKSTCNGNDLAIKYFSEHPAQEWSFEEFENAFNENKSTKANQKTIKSMYLNALKSLKNKSNIPENIKSRIIQLTDLAEKKPSSVTFHLSTGDSSTINNIGTGIINFSQTQQPQQNASDERDSDEDETKFPSDLSIDHHPRRTSNYSLLFEGSSSHSEGSADNFRWMLDNTCISDLCFNVKSTTIQMVNNINPAQLSDIRLLAVNDIYLFDKNHASSISKYFLLLYIMLLSHRCYLKNIIQKMVIDALIGVLVLKYLLLTTGFPL